MLIEDVTEGLHDKYNDRAIFMAGGPGSGKSYVADKLFGGLGLKHVNSDIMYEFLMKKQNMSMDPETIASPQGQETRARAKEITGRKRKLYLTNRLGLIIDGTGRNFGNIQLTKDLLEESGYKTAMVFVNTSLEVALERNEARPRSIDPALVEKLWGDVQHNISKYQALFGPQFFTVVDNSVPGEDFTFAQKRVNWFLNS